MVNSGCLKAKLASAPVSDSAAPSEEHLDVVLLRGPTEDGAGTRVLRCREGRLEAGDLRPLSEGKPIHGEVVRLHPRAQCPHVCDVEVQLERAESRSADGPPQVANDAYRRNWDAIFRNGAAKQLN